MGAPPIDRPPDLPLFARLAGHPVRWALLAELARSDRQVNELTGRLGAPQALVSYHLARLREGGLVSARRSSFDGRASYYRIDLPRCGEELSALGRALHPGLALRRDQPTVAARGRQHKTRVLFACTGNGARSQIAEALLQHLAGDRMTVVSGGSHPKPVHPNAVRVLAERGIDIGSRRSKPLSRFEDRRFHVVVTLCDRVREACPEFSTRAEAIHWSIEDPGRAEGDDDATYPQFQALAYDLESRLGYLVAQLDHARRHGPTTDDPAQETTNHGRP